MSKGSSPRPLSVDPETFADRWERTFENAVVAVCGACGPLRRFDPVCEHTVRMLRTPETEETT